MIWIYREDRLCRAASLLEALGMKEGGKGEKPEAAPGGQKTEGKSRGPVISVVGAGGKTSLLHRLADEYVEAGRQVFVTTTTHIMEEGGPCFLVDPSAGQIRKTLAARGQAWAGASAPGGKLAALPEPVLEEALGFGIPVLIEADGARRMPMKVPARHEPVIIRRTTHVLSVYGLDAVGKKLEEVCFRSEQAEKLLRKKKGGIVAPEDIAFLAASGEAGKKRCSPGMIYTVVLNKADHDKEREYALDICRKLKDRGICNVIVTSYVRDGRG